MKRHMVRNDMNLNEFNNRLSDETKAWIDSDPAAKVMYDRIIESTKLAAAYYDAAERGEVTRWVPENGGGDCYISPLADGYAEAALVLRFALSGYALKIGKRDVSRNIDDAAMIACYVNETDGDIATKPTKSTCKSVCKTNIAKCLRESWNTAEIIPINERWSCGITVTYDEDTLRFHAILTNDGDEVSKVAAWCNRGTAKKDVIEYCVTHMLADYKNHIRYKGIDLEAIDKKAVVAGINDAYDYFYDHYDEVEGYDEGMALGNWLLKNRNEFVRELVAIRKDVFSSDREVAALGYAVHELAA